MSFRKNYLQEDTRFRVLRLLEANPDISQRELADAVGISVGGAHYVLKALIEKGLVKLGNFGGSQDKRRYAYILTPRGAAEKASITARFLNRKLKEHEALTREIADLKAELSTADAADEAD